MTPQDAPLFIERLTAVAEVFDAKCSEAKITLYFEALKDLDVFSVLEALDAAITTCKFFPKPVEIRELAIGTVEDLAESAWVEVKDEMRRLGAYGSPVFEAAAAFAVTDTFGSWPAACGAELSPEMWASKRKEFLNAYRRHWAGEGSGRLTQLASRFELDRGFPAARRYALDADRKELPAGDR